MFAAFSKGYVPQKLALRKHAKVGICTVFTAFIGVRVFTVFAVFAVFAVFVVFTVFAVFAFSWFSRFVLRFSRFLPFSRFSRFRLQNPLSAHHEKKEEKFIMYAQWGGGMYVIHFPRLPPQDS